MYNPPHPGEFIRAICLKPLNLSVAEAAKKLGVSRKVLSELLNGKTGISEDMALRLARVFNTTPESWITQQINYDKTTGDTMKITLDQDHFQHEDYKQRITAKQWKQMLLDGDDERGIAFRGKAYRFIAKPLGYGVVEITKEIKRKI